MTIDTPRVTLNSKPPHPRGASAGTGEGFEAVDDEARAAPTPKPKKDDDELMTVTDSKGRVLKLRELTLLEEVDVLSVMPPHHENSQQIQTIALMAARVASIDGAFQAIPLTANLYRAMLHIVGREGLIAVAESLRRPEGNDTVALAKN